MSKEGIRTNSFYETREELGIPERTEEEEEEYKRLIGMPFAKTYEELLDSLR